MIIFFICLYIRLCYHKLMLSLVISLITLMLVADISWLISQLITLKSLYLSNDDSINILVSSGIALMIAFVCFSLSHWVFCFKYWSCAQRLTLLLNHKNSKQDDAKILRINIVMCLLNVIIPGVYAWYYTIVLEDKSSNFFYVISTMNLLLQLASLYFLSSALY